MGDTTGIAWTTSTFNPWVGCSKVGPGCDHCYAEAWDARFYGEAAHWGPGVPRRRTNIKNWNKPLRWQRLRREALDRGENPPPHRVFSASLADVFDNEVPVEWRMDLLRLIRETPDLEWQLVTKRISNVRRMVTFADRLGCLPPNAILIPTIVNQEEADRDLPRLVTLKRDGIAQHIGVSYEPALGPVDWSPWLTDLDWIIVGGESAQGGAAARPFDMGWAAHTILHCLAAGVPVFVKQMGSHAIASEGVPNVLCVSSETGRWRIHFADPAGADPAEWPEVLRVREFPDLGVR